MGNLHEKLKAIQSELKAPKGQTNSFGGYKYRSCEDILESVKPLAHAQGCTVTLSDDIVEVGGRVYVKATARLIDGEGKIETTAFARESEYKKGMDQAQITGSSSSYARKYALNGLFCIDDTKDDDTRENTDRKKASDFPMVVDEKHGDIVPAYAPPKVDKASSGDVLKIAQLCKETSTPIPQLHGHFGVVNVPTKDQAKKMIAALEKKLSKELDAAAQA